MHGMILLAGLYYVKKERNNTCQKKLVAYYIRVAFKMWCHKYISGYRYALVEAKIDVRIAPKCQC